MILISLRKGVIFGCLLLGANFLWQGSYIKIKAVVADWLISASWAQRVPGQAPAKPWPWADTRVVARLSVARLGIQHFVMQDASGESLAFGPGSMLLRQPPGGEGYTLIAGHRDTHFNFLSRIQPGDLLELDNYFGKRSLYRIQHSRLLNIEREELRIDPRATGMTLVTCWPFDAVSSGGPMRFLVNAERIDDVPNMDKAERRLEVARQSILKKH